VIDELLPAAWHRTDRYANNRVEADQTTVVSRRGFEFHCDISGVRHKPDGVLVVPGQFPSMTLPVWVELPEGPLCHGPDRR
jgi:hypothetical protein